MIEKYWFIYNDDHHLGPFTFEQMLEKANREELDPDHLVWQEGDPDWLPFYDHPHIQHLLSKQEAEEYAKKREEIERLEKEKKRKERELELQAKFSKTRNRKATKKKVVVHKEPPLGEPPELPPLPPMPDVSASEGLIEPEGDTFGEDVFAKAEEENIPDLPPDLPVDFDIPTEPIAPVIQEVSEEENAEEDAHAFVEEESEDFIEEVPEELDEEFNDTHEDHSQVVIEEVPPHETENSVDYFAEDTGQFPSELIAQVAAKENDEYEEVEEEVEAEEERDESYEEEFFEEEDDFELKPSRFYGSLGLVAVGIAFIFFFFTKIGSDIRTPFDVSNAGRESLTRVANRNFNGKVDHRLRVTTDTTRLWLATNFPYDGAAYLRLKSLPGRLLKPEKGKGVFIPESVAVQAQAKLKGKMAFFGELSLLNGDSLYPGEYRYTIKGKRDDLYSELINAVKDKPIFKDMTFAKVNNREFEVTGTILIAPIGKEEFEKRLKVQEQRVERKLIRPLKEFKERYETFIGLLDRINNIYQAIMKRITKGRSIYMFENRYNKEVGPMMTDLIGDCYRRHLSYLNQDPVQSEGYKELNDFGKDIGLIASEMVTKTKRIRILKRRNTLDNVAYFKAKSNELKEKGQEKIALIEKQLKELQ